MKTRRKIKVRIWDTQNKKMITDSVCYNLAIGADGTIKPGISENILMQFIGEVDKNGKEIFEGDIVELKTNFHTRDKKFGWQNVAIFMAEDNSFKGRNVQGHVYDLTEETDDGSYSWTILGNIYENAELLNNKAVN